MGTFLHDEHELVSLATYTYPGVKDLCHDRHHYQVVLLWN